jgi:hypothetical protein
MYEEETLTVVESAAIAPAAAHFLTNTGRLGQTPSDVHFLDKYAAPAESTHFAQQHRA